MELSVDQITGMAPDSASLSAGKKLSAAKNWSDVGRSEGALWGKCQGSSLYQIKIDLSNLGYHCNCPSRKFPCKHVLGLLLFTAESSANAPASAEPEWVTEWLGKRKSRQEQAAQKASEKPKSPTDEKAAARRAQKRESRIEDGLDRLDLWMKDLVRNGLGGLEQKTHHFWEEQAKRLVDAQAPALASRVSRLAIIPGATRDWPERLLMEFGQLKLLVQAARRMEELDPELQSDVRQLLGWTVNQAELEASGEKVADSWIVGGQWIDDDDRVRAQRSWLVGRRSGRTALVLQFAVGSQPYAESIVPGVEQEATLVFFPGRYPQRAKLSIRSGAAAPLNERVPGSASIEEFLNTTTNALAKQPWVSAFGCVLHDVTLIPNGDEWSVRDSRGASLKLHGRDHWVTLAISGGRPADMTGEWDGERLRPLGVFTNGAFQTV